MCVSNSARSKSEDDARSALMDEFALTRIQCDAILRMQLRRLTGLEREKLQDDLGETREEIEYHRKVLTDDGVVKEIIREDIHELMEKFKDERRTSIEEAAEEINYADLIAEEDVVVTLTHQGYVKRTPLTSYRSQGRGGTGVSGGSVREDDFVKSLCARFVTFISITGTFKKPFHITILHIHLHQ